MSASAGWLARQELAHVRERAGQLQARATELHETLQEAEELGFFDTRPDDAPAQAVFKRQVIALLAEIQIATHQDLNAFAALLEWLSVNEPNCGWYAGALPTLSLADYATILRAEPDLMDDVQLPAAAVANALELGEGAVTEAIAQVVLPQLKTLLRNHLLSALLMHSEAREIARATAAAERMGLSHDQYAEHIRGVSR